MLDRFVEGGEAVLQELYRDVLDFLGAERGLRIPLGPLRVVDSGDLNASVSQTEEGAEITVSAKLLFLLHLFNRALPTMGAGFVLDRDGDLRTSQDLFDHALQLVFAMSPPGPPAPAYAQIAYGSDGFDEFQREYLGHRAARRLQARDGAVEGVREIEALAERLSHPAQRGLLFEWQFKFLVWHELAHVLLGHAGSPASRDHELAADREAARLLLEQLRSRHRPGPLDVTPVAVLGLLLVVKFVEDLIDATNRATRFAISDAFKDGFREIRHDYPPARIRAAHLLEAFPDGFTPPVTAVATLMEHGLLALKRDIQHGLIDLRHFKWYCRVRALDMTAAFTTRKMEPDVRAKVIGMLDINRGWDTADLRRGPLVPEVFGPEWHSTIFTGEAA